MHPILVVQRLKNKRQIGRILNVHDENLGTNQNAGKEKTKKKNYSILFMERIL